MTVTVSVVSAVPAGTVIDIVAVPVGVIIVGVGRVAKPKESDRVSVTGLLYPSIDVTVTELVPVVPAGIVTEGADNEKSGVVTGWKVEVRGLPMPVTKS